MNWTCVQNAFSRYFLFVLVILSYFTTKVIALPSGTERWKHPCGTSSVVSHSAGIPPRPPVEIIEDILIRVREGQDLSVSLEEKIANERIQSMQRVSFLQMIHHEGFPDVSPTTEEEIQNSFRNLTKTYLESYRKLATAQIFIEQMKFDEEVYEDNKYEKEIINTESKLYDVLCLMNEMISNTDASIEHVTREVMQMHLRTLSERINRFMRDYISVKDTTKLLNNLIVEYVAMKNHHAGK